jgi:hypothetical protein
MYEINYDNKATQKFAEFDWTLVEFIAEKKDVDELDDDSQLNPA